MRERTRKTRKNEPGAVSVARQVQVTNAEILGDLLYPAPVERLGSPHRKRRS